MNKRPFLSALLLLCAMVLPVGLMLAGLPTSATGITASGVNGGDSSGANINTPERAGQSNPTPNSGPVPTPSDNVIENAKPNDLPAQSADLRTRTSTDNPSAKIRFGRVESVDKEKRMLRVRDQQGNVSNVVLGDKTVYGHRKNKASAFSDIKTGDRLNYSIGNDGQVDQLNWYNQKVPPR